MMQQIIVYRSPGEAAMWDLLQNSPNAFPLIIAVVAFITSFALVERFTFNRNTIKGWGLNPDTVYLILSAIVGIAVGWWLWN
jgi:hypothetical protein